MNIQRIGRMTCSALMSALFIMPLAHAAGNDSTTWEPPKLNAPDGRIGVLDAVRNTLESDPIHLLSKQDAKQQFGIMQELLGAFDWTITGQLSYEHREQELRESIIQAETDKRNQFRDVEAIACPEIARLGSEIDQLNAARAAAPGTIRVTADPSFDATLRVVEALILTAGSDPERTALLQQRFSLIDQEIATSQEALEGVTFVCNRARENIERLGEVPTEEEFDIGRLEVRGQRLFKNGVFFSPFLTGAYDSTNYVGKEQGFFVPDQNPDGSPRISPSGIPLQRLIDFGGKNIQDLYTFEVGFEVNLPLLRGRGRAATGAGVDASQIDFEASELVVKHTASESALSTVVAYWNLVAAQQRVEVLRRSVELQTQLVQITRDLIDGDELPGADLARSLAGESNARAQLESSLADLNTARTDLLRAMGYTVEGVETLPVADADFPSAPDDAELQDELYSTLVQAGLSSRFDLEAARRLIQSGQILAEAARLGLRPRLDLNLGLSSIARGESSFSDATDKWVAPTWSVLGQFEKPLGNNAAKGLLLQQQTLTRQREIDAANLERLVRLGVVETYAALIEARQALAFAEESARQFEATVSSELEKLRLSETTLLDSILTEQQRTASVLAVISARFQVATLVARLRFETGTLIESSGNQYTAALERLITVPTGR